MWLTKFETESPYEALMYEKFIGRFERIEYDGQDITSDEVYVIAFEDLLVKMKASQEEMTAQDDGALFMVFGKQQEVTEERHRQGIHFHFLDILGWTKSIAEARDLFKQGKVGDGILMRDKTANSSWRLLTGQQIIDLHALADGRPLSFKREQEPEKPLYQYTVSAPVNGLGTIGSTEPLEWNHATVSVSKEGRHTFMKDGQEVEIDMSFKYTQTPVQEGIVLHVDGPPVPVGDVFIPSIFGQRQLILISPMGMSPEQAEHSYNLMQGAFNLAEMELDKLPEEAKKAAIQALERARSVACCRKDLVVGTLMINPTHLAPGQGNFTI